MIANPNEKFKSLLEDHKSGKITTAQLDTECAYWLLECFAEINYKPMPSTPREYQDFLDLSFEKKQKISSEVHNNPAIRDFLDMKQRIKSENYSNLEKLKEFKNYIPKEDFVSHARYAEKINEFMGRVNW